MDNRRNHYRILRVQPDASPDVVRRSYRTLMQKLKLHPDLGGDDWNARLLNDAWSTLKDPERRAAYDQVLLARYGIEVLSLGQRFPGLRAATEAGGNRRNHYRLLEVQSDAPHAVIEASWRVLRARPGADRALLDSAWKVLGDSARRRAYDRRLRGEPEPAPERPRPTLTLPDPVRELAPLEAPSRASKPVYRPLITSYCPFCKAPCHAESARWSGDACAECSSPLSPPPSVRAGAGTRDAARLERQGRLEVYVDWPAPASAARLEDLSPTGARFTFDRALEEGWAVRLEGTSFAAVGEIAYRKLAGDDWAFGARFLTVRFSKPAGTFFSGKA